VSSHAWPALGVAPAADTARRRWQRSGDDVAADLAAKDQEIAQLRAQLAAKNAPPSAQPGDGGRRPEQQALSRRVEAHRLHPRKLDALVRAGKVKLTDHHVLCKDGWYVNPAANAKPTADRAAAGRPAEAPTREQIERLEQLLRARGAGRGVALETWHHFADGLVARTIFIPAGTFLTGAPHKAEHLNVCAGDITVWTEQGMKRLTGYHVLPSLPGAKRVGRTRGHLVDHRAPEPGQRARPRQARGRAGRGLRHAAAPPPGADREHRTAGAAAMSFVVVAVGRCRRRHRRLLGRPAAQGPAPAAGRAQGRSRRTPRKPRPLEVDAQKSANDQLAATKRAAAPTRSPWATRAAPATRSARPLGARLRQHRPGSKPASDTVLGSAAK
jgi:hypothetical protein